MAKATSLFELQQTIDGTSRVPHRTRAASSAHRAARRPRNHAPRQAPASGRPTAFAFDHGEPIELTYGDDVVRAASAVREAVAFGAAAGTAQPVRTDSTSAELAPFEPGASDTIPSLASALDATAGYTVESFEAEEALSEDGVPLHGVPAIAPAESPADQASAMARARRTEHVDAFERELRGMVDRQQSPSAEEPPAPPPQQPQPPAHEPVPPPGKGTSARYDHGIFDVMAGGMSYATTFEHRPVALKRVFAEFDRELDGDSVELIAPPSFPDAAAGSAAYALGTRIPDDAVLAADLDAFDAVDPPVPPAPPGSGAPDPAEHASPAAPAPVNEAVADDPAAIEQESTTT